MAKGLSFKVGADTRKLVTEMGKAESAIGRLADKTRKLGFGSMAKGADALAGKLRKIAIPDLKPGPAMHAVAKLKGKLNGLRGTEKSIRLDIEAVNAAKKLKDMQAKLQQLKDTRPQVPLDVDGKKLADKVKRLSARLVDLRKANTVPLDADGVKLESKIARLKGKLKEIKGGDPNVPLTLDGKKLEGKIKGFEARLEKMKAQRRVMPLDADGKKLVAKLKTFQARLEKIKSARPQVELDADGKKLEAKVRRAEVRLKALQAKRPTLDLSLKTKSALDQLQKLQLRLNAVKSRQIKVGVEIGGNMGAAKAQAGKFQKAMKLRFPKIEGMQGMQKQLARMKLMMLKAGMGGAGALAVGMGVASNAFTRMSVATGRLNKVLSKLAAGGARAAKGSVLLLGYASRSAAKSLMSMARAAMLAGGAAIRGLKNITFGALKMGAVAATAAVAGLSLALKKSVEAAASLEMLEV